MVVPGGQNAPSPSCRPQLQISDTHRATGLSGRKQKDPKGRLPNPYPPQQFFTARSPATTRKPRAAGTETRTQRAGGPLTSPCLLSGGPQALTRLKRLHGRDQTASWCADPTTNGTRRRAPSANQHQGSHVVPPPSPRLSYPYASLAEAAIRGPITSPGQNGPLGLGVHG